MRHGQQLQSPAEYDPAVRRRLFCLRTASGPFYYLEGSVQRLDLSATSAFPAKQILEVYGDDGSVICHHVQRFDGVWLRVYDGADAVPETIDP